MDCCVFLFHNLGKRRLGQLVFIHPVVQTISYGLAKNTKRSTTRLVRALLESGKTFDLAILIGRQRTSCAFQTSIAHLKLLSSVVDQVQDTLLHYTDFLAVNVQSPQYAQQCPNFASLITEHQLSPEVAWLLVRPLLSPLGTSSGHEGASFSSQPLPLSLGLDRCKAMTPQLYCTFWQLQLYDLHVPKDRYQSEIEKQKILSNEESSGAHSRDAPDSSSAQRRKRERERALWVREKLEKEFQQQQNNHLLILSQLHLQKHRWFSENSSAPSRTVSEMLVDSTGCAGEENQPESASPEKSSDPQLSSDVDGSMEEAVAKVEDSSLDSANASSHSCASPTPPDPSHDEAQLSWNVELLKELIRFCVQPRCTFSATDAVFCSKFILLLHDFKLPQFSLADFYDQVRDNSDLFCHEIQNYAADLRPFCRLFVSAIRC